MPHLNASGHGDQLVRVIVKIPDKISKKQEELIKEFQGKPETQKGFFDRMKEKIVK